MRLLRVWAGPMCVAKTTGALHVARRYARHGKKVILLRPASSRRDHEKDGVRLSTKNGETFPCFDIASVEDILHYVGKSDVVWLDEPNHFRNEHRLIDIVPKIRKTSIVLVSGLGATSEMEPFGRAMPFLLATADRVHWLSADCDACGDHDTATRSLYIGESPKHSQVQVGGVESYCPACPACWTELMKLDPSARRETIIRV